jgi:hypothetical protein
MAGLRLQLPAGFLEVTLAAGPSSPAAGKLFR